MYNQILLEKRLKTILLFILLLSCKLSVAATISSASSGDWSSNAWPNTTRSGTITTSTSSAVITGLSTSFTTEISVGNIIRNSSNVAIGTVASIQSNTSLTLTSNAATTNINITFKSQGIGSGDIVRISSGHTVTIDNNYTCSGLTFLSNSSNSKITFNPNNNYTFVVNGTVSFGTPSVDAVNNSLEIGSNSVIVNAVSFTSANIMRQNKITISSGSFKCKGNFQSSSAYANLLESTSSSNVTFSGTVSTFTILITGTGSTFTYNSNSTQTIRPATYYNLTIGGAGIKTSSSVTVNGTFTIDSISTLSTGITYGSEGKLKYNSVINRTVSSNEWPTTFTATGGIEIANVGQITLNESKTLQTNTQLIINVGAKLNTANYNLLLACNFTNNGSFIAGSSNITIFGTLATQSIGSISTTGDLTFSKTSGTVTSTGAFNVTNFYMSGNGGTLNLGSYNHAVSNIFYISDGTLNLNTGSINLANEINSTGGIFNTDQGTVIYSGNNQNVLPISYYNLSFLGNGTTDINNVNTNVLNNFTVGDSVVITLNGNLNIDGNIHVALKGILFSNTRILNIGGNITVDSLCYFGYTESTFILDGSSIQTFYTLVPNQNTVKNIFLQNGTKAFNSDLKVTDTLSILENSKLQLGANVTLEIAGTFNTYNATSTIKAATCGNASNTLIISGSSNFSNIYIEPGYHHFNNLDFSKTSSDVTISSPIAFNGQLNFSANSSKIIFSSELNLYGNNLIFPSATNKWNTSSTFSLRIGNYSTCGVGNSNTIVLPNNLFSNGTIPTENLIIDCGHSGSTTLGSQLFAITSELKILSGNLNTNGNIILKSTSTGTANVPPIPSGSVISGDVTVERFIPGGEGKRKWRFLSSSINISGSTALSQYKDDIFVTAPAGTGGSFDINPFSTNASIRTYNETVSGGANNGWTDPTNINNTISTGSAVEVFVRGSRQLENPYLNWTTPDDVTIDYIGNLNQGTITKSLSYTNTNTAIADGFNLVGNPYASAINFDSTGWTKTNMNNQYWSYNPNTSMYGIYDADLHTGTNSISKYIASGQGFFVKATSAGASITFTENIKCVNSSANNFFRSGVNTLDSIPILRIKLENDSGAVDETIIYLSDGGTANGTDTHDATKFYNDALNIYSVAKDQHKLAINEIRFPSMEDTIKLSVWSYDSSSIMKTHHRLTFEGLSSIHANLGVYLIDKLNNSITNIRDLPNYDFQITENTSTYGNQRFEIVLKNKMNSVSTENGNSTIQLFPNPAGEKLNLLFEEQVNTFNYEIYTLLGEKVMADTGRINTLVGTLDLSKIEAGTYILKIYNQKTISTHKFIKTN